MNQTDKGIRPEAGMPHAHASETSTEHKKAQAEELKEQAKGEVKHRIQPFFSERKSRVVNQLNDIAGALRETQSHHKEKKTGEYAGYSAEKVEYFSNYLESKQMDDLMNDFQNFARSRPWTVMGGAFVLGFSAVRFLKASGRSSELASQGRTTPGPRYAGTV